MMKRGKQVIRSYMTLEYDFTGIRIQNGFLTPVDWKLTANLIAPVKKGKAKQDVEQEASLVYQRLYFWLDTSLPNIVLVDVSRDEDLYLANLTSNIMMYCPGNPGDDLVAQLLHSKLSALAGDTLLLGEVHLKGSDTSIQYTFDPQDNGYSLPAIASDYLGAESRHSEPWWIRNDGFSFEFVKPSEEDGITEEELYQGIIDPMTEFERVIAELSDTHIGVTKEPAKIVQIEKWKPKTI